MKVNKIKRSNNTGLVASAIAVLLVILALGAVFGYEII